MRLPHARAQGARNVQAFRISRRLSQSLPQRPNLVPAIHHQAMIPARTLLILGAGASRPYLFPTGAQLTDLILERKDKLERGDNRELLANMRFDTGPFYANEQLIPAQEQNPFLHYSHWLKTTLKMYGVDEEDLRQFQGRFRLSQAYSIDAFVADNPGFKRLASLMIAAILLRCERLERLEGDWY